MKLKLFIVLTLLCALLCACGNEPSLMNPEDSLSQNIGQPATTDPADPAETTEPTTASTEEAAPPQTGTVVPPTEDPNKIVYDSLPTGLTATKVASVTEKRFHRGDTAGVVYYTEDEMFGILSPDGSIDSGAKYTSCEQEGNYFLVTTVDPETVSYEDPATVNCRGMVDNTGREIIPQNYAHIEALNDRYMYVCEVTEVTDNEDEAIIYFTSSWVSLAPGEDDILYKGIWYVYDILEGRFLEGVTGTHYTNVQGRGDFITYYDAEKNRCIVGSDGKALSEYAIPFVNGCYSLDGAIYTSDHVKVFDESNGYSIYSFTEGYYIANKYDSNGRSYVLMDYMGNVVSAEFSESPDIYGSLLFVNDQLCTFNGEPVIDGTFEYVTFDDQLGNAWFLKNGDSYTLVTKDGTVLWQGTKDDTLYIDNYDFHIEKEVDGKDLYYSFAQKDYVFEGYQCGPWLIQTSVGNFNYDVIDTLSGETILAGYRDYEVVTNPGYAFYIYAENPDGSFDIYSIG